MGSILFGQNHCFSANLSPDHSNDPDARIRQFSNIYGSVIYLNSLPLISAIFSAVKTLASGLWTMVPIEEEVNAMAAKLTFVNLFLFRFCAWVLIISMLHSFSSPLIIGQTMTPIPSQVRTF